MKYSPRRQPPSVGLGFNATPMVDVIFMLTIFFMLVSRFSEAELISMNLPDPDKSKAESQAVPDRVIINCRPEDPNDPEGSAVLYSIGPNLPEPLEVLGQRMAAFRQANPKVRVIIRADRRLPYEQVNRLMKVVAAAGIETLNVAAYMDDRG